MQEYNTYFKKHMFLIFVRIASVRQSNKYPKHMFYEEFRIKEAFLTQSFCILRILYNNKFILRAASLGTNYAVVMKVDYLAISCFS